MFTASALIELSKQVKPHLLIIIKQQYQPILNS